MRIQHSPAPTALEAPVAQCVACLDATRLPLTSCSGERLVSVPTTPIGLKYMVLK